MAALVSIPRPLVCGYTDCQVPAGQFVPTINGDFVCFNFQTRHNGDWHRQGVTLRQMLIRAMEINPLATKEIVAEICCANDESVLNT